MSIRGTKSLSSASAAAVHSVSILPSSSSSVSSSSSITAANSSIDSSQDSSNSYPFSLFATTTHRCHGLDLLVKAIHQVNAGSVIGVPYIQRRVTIRRKRRELYIFSGLFGDEKDSINSKKKQKKVKKNSIAKKGPRGLPKSPDSVLKPWGRRRSAAGDAIWL